MLFYCQGNAVILSAIIIAAEKIIAP
jgi:hypothetical protein